MLLAPDGGVPNPVTKAESVIQHAGTGLRSSLPADWLEPSWLGLERWQWLGLPLLLVAIIALTLVFARVTRFIVSRFTKSRPAVAHVLSRLDAPLWLWWASILARITWPLLSLSGPAEEFWQRLFKVTFALAFFWGALRGVGAWSDFFGSTAYASQHPGSRSLVNLFSRVSRFALAAFAILAALAEFGYSVTSVLAGLGIGGIALALGAQKTLENVFGAFALAVDQPIREGDLVRIGDLTGTVESIGLRSTRIRTIERTVVSIPNGKLADMQLETFAARDRLRFTQKLGLATTTTPDQLKDVMTSCREVLASHEQLWPDSAVVNFVGLSQGSLDLEIGAWFGTTNWDEFRSIREQLLLQFIEALAKHKVQLAAPVVPAK